MEIPTLHQIKITGGLWFDRQKANREGTLPVVYEICRSTGRIAAMDIDRKRDETFVTRYWDADVAKWMEGAAYSLINSPDRELQKTLDEIIAVIAKSQDKNGYFNAYYQAVTPRGKRFDNLRDGHELFCAGHLIEAAIARYELDGDQTFLNIVKDFAKHIDSLFGPEESKLKGYPGHQEIELALVKLYQVTQDESFLKLSEYFLCQRGRKPHYFMNEAVRHDEIPADYDLAKFKNHLDYYQAYEPIEEKEEIVGHAVRALYYWIAVADVARENKDATLLEYCRKIWADTVERKMYITGAPGSLYNGEVFCAPYELPNLEAYGETCATIAMALFAWRMFLIERDASYVDVMERAFYNGMLAGVSLSGKEFFYVNPMACEPSKTLSNGKKHEPRTPGFECFCCPPNLVRTVASIGRYFYAVEDDQLWINLFNTSTAKLNTNGVDWIIDQQTNYPWNGAVKIKLNPEKPTRLRVMLRLPGWCQEFALSVNGKVEVVQAQKGYLIIDRVWSAGDEISYVMTMEAQLFYTNSACRDNCGRAAICRGPIVYCLEEYDNGEKIDRIRLDKQTTFKLCQVPGLPENIPGLQCCGEKLGETTPGTPLYSTRSAEYKQTTITAVPYFAWNNRNFGDMIVWIRVK